MIKKYVLYMTGIFILLIHTSLVYAEFNEDYQGYLQTYQAYRTAYNRYLINRSQYLQYKTLNSQTEALTAVKEFLSTRDTVLLSHISLLRIINIDATYATLMDNEANFLSSHRDQIPSLGSLDDAVRLSDKAAEHHIPFQITSRQIVANSILTNIDTLKIRFDLLSQDADVLTQTLRSQGKDVAVAERWLIEAKSKRLQAEQKMNEIRSKVAALEGQDTEQVTKEYNKIQTNLFEANQYMKEALSNISEFTQNLKYGNF